MEDLFFTQVCAKLQAAEEPRSRLQAYFESCYDPIRKYQTPPQTPPTQPRIADNAQAAAGTFPTVDGVSLPKTISPPTTSARPLHTADRDTSKKRKRNNDKADDEQAQGHRPPQAKSSSVRHDTKKRLCETALLPISSSQTLPPVQPLSRTENSCPNSNVNDGCWALAPAGPRTASFNSLHTKPAKDTGSRMTRHRSDRLTVVKGNARAQAVLQNPQRGHLSLTASTGRQCDRRDNMGLPSSRYRRRNMRSDDQVETAMIGTEGGWKT